jgi:adenine-specific DNA-methyltransferase
MTPQAPTDLPEKMPLTSLDIAEEKREAMRQALQQEFPEVFAEGHIDFDQLKRVLGEWVEPDRERFGLNWPGKAACMKVIQAPSVGTLKPCREESVDWDTTQNLFIEGDNLEVLKLLQKAYFGKVKMIYIDPPYNTGKEFIYPDKYAETLDTYLEYTGQKDSEGRKFSTNTDTSGRFHSRWLNMMYPRLYLAKNLLRDDGLIFISISDHEVTDLRLLMNEIFGEENFSAQLVWKSRKYPDSRAKTGISTDHEYILVYGRTEVATLRGIERDESKFSNPDNDPRGPWMSRSILGLATKAQRPNLHYEIVDPKTNRSYTPPEDTGWRYSKDRMQTLIDSQCILFPAKPDGRPREKKFRADMQTEHIAFPSIIDDVFTSDGTNEIRYLFGEEVFDFSKPSQLLARLIQQGMNENDIVLDFFAGSGTTAQAVIEQSQQDGVNRKYILIQLPEKTCRSDFPTIADICKERIRRVIQKHIEQTPEYIGKLGFRTYKLTSSCFKQWDGDVAGLSEEQLVLKLKEHAEHIDRKASAEDILYEVLLKDGFELTVPIQRLTLAGKEVFSIEGNQLLICLEPELTQELMDAMAALDPSRVIVLDAGFQNNDQLKANAVQTFKARARDKETAIVFRTV